MAVYPEEVPKLAIGTAVRIRTAYRANKYNAQEIGCLMAHQLNVIGARRSSQEGEISLAAAQ